MSIYAHVLDGAVAEPLYTPLAGLSIADCFEASVAARWIDVTGVSPLPQSGWTATQTGSTWTFAAPIAPAPTLAQQAMALLFGGLTISSATAPALNATYPADEATQTKLLKVQAVLRETGAFPAGATTWDVRDSASNWHNCTPAQFTAIAVALAAFVAPIDLIVDGHTGISLPPASAAIA